MSDDRVQDSQRTSAFSRNLGLEELLRDINYSLWVSEKKALQEYGSPSLPVVLVFGPMRSGTTLFMQWLASTGIVAYPTNMLSRFYHAPIVGAKIQLLLTDPRYRFRDELGDFQQSLDFRSENGKTRGALAPNEFWYFWRRFLPDSDRDVWTDDELRNVLDKETMLAELSGVIDVFQKPFAAKGMLFNYNIPFLNAIFDKAVFVQIQRDPVSNIASVIDARKKQFGSEDKWYSFKIPEYEELKNLDPTAQAAGQVHYINKAVSKGMSAVDDSRKMIVRYEDFCGSPRRVFEELTYKVGLANNHYRGPSYFDVSRLSDDVERSAIEKAYLSFRSSGV